MPLQLPLTFSALRLGSLRVHAPELYNTLNRILTDPAFHDYLAILKGARNGLVYGAKVRFPHALIMAILFGKGDWWTRSRVIFQATKTHSLNLAKFVAIYKTAMLAQKRVNTGIPRTFDTFIAGLIGGLIVFGDRTPVNEQIVLYVCSRVVASAIPREPLGGAAPKGKVLYPDKQYFAAFAAICWGLVMWLFEHKEQSLQSGMYSSMVYLYRDSERWNTLRTLLWHNK